MEKHALQVILSSKTITDIQKIQELQKDKTMEDVISAIITYDVAPELLTKKNIEFFEKYFQAQKETLDNILNQCYITAIESDSIK